MHGRDVGSTMWKSMGGVVTKYCAELCLVMVKT